MAKKNKKELFENIKKSMDNSMSGMSKDWQGPPVKQNQEARQQTAAPLALPTFRQFQAQALPKLPQITQDLNNALGTSYALSMPKVWTRGPVETAKPAASTSAPEKAQTLTALPSTSAPLQKLEKTGEAARRAALPSVSSASQGYDPKDPAQVYAQIRNQRRLGRYGDDGIYQVLGGDEIADYMIQRDIANREYANASFLKDPVYAAGTLMDTLGYAFTDVGRGFLDSKKQKEMDERNTAYLQAIGPVRGGGKTIDQVTASAERGAANFNAGTAQMLNFLVGERLRALGWENNPVSNFSDAMTAQQKMAQANYDRQFADASKGAQIAGDIGSSAMEALPDLILLLLSRGGSAAAQGETMFVKGGARLAGREAAIAGAQQASRIAAAKQTALAVARDTAKNPMFWTSFTRTAGPSYYYAKEQGASDFEASVYALLNASAGSLVEIGGGVQTLPWELQKGGSALWTWVKSMFDEGKEEVVQGVLERSLQNLTYGADNPLFSTKDENAILNPLTSAKEFGMGAAVAGVLGGPSSLQQGVYNLRTGSQAARADVKTSPLTESETPAGTQAETRQAEQVQTEQTTPNNNTYLPAARIVTKLQAGETVSNSELNAAMRTPEFAAVYQQQTGQKLPTGQTNSQLRATIRAELSSTETVNEPEVVRDASGLGTITLENGTTITVPRPLQKGADAGLEAARDLGNREGSITLMSKDAEETISGPRPLERGGSQETAGAEADRSLQRGDESARARTDETSDPAYEAARAAAQPDAVTQNMTDEQKAEYAKKLLDEGVEESEVFRRVYGSNVYTSPVDSAADAETGTNEGSAPEEDSSPALAKLGVKISSPITVNRNRRSVVEGNRAARKADRQLKAKIRSMNPSRAEKEFAQGIANGLYSEADIPITMDSSKVKELAGMYSAAMNNTAAFVQQIRRDIKRGVREKLDGMFASADGVQVPSLFRMQLITKQRVIRMMFEGKTGEAINEYLFDPVDDNSAEQIKFENRMFDRVRDFKLTKAESVLVARVLEGRAVQKEVAMLDPDMQKRVEAVAQSDDPKKARWGEFKIENDENFQLALRYKAWLNTQARMEGQNTEKINKAADAYAEAYNDFYEAINDFLVNHGYEPIGFIQGYTPHMQTEDVKSGMAGILRRLGLDPEVDNLPTEIAGRTDTFKPGKQWNPYFLQRMSGDPDADYNAVEGYESYVRYMSSVLYHTDDIMKLREVAMYFRTRYADENIRDLVEQARSLEGKTPEDIVQFLVRMNRVAPGTKYDQNQADEALDSYVESLFKDKANKSKFGGFVTWLDDYTNSLAGKQTMIDRAVENFGGRRLLNLGNRLTKIFGEATIVGNLSSALNQTAQIPTLIGDVGVLNVTHAAKDIIFGQTRRGGWDKESNFLTGKRGVSYLSEPSGYQKVMDFAAIPFEAVDDVTSQLYVRAKYVQCIKQGMDHKAAMKAADRYASEMVGSRIKGAKPMVFESKLLKPFTTFQLEIANNLSKIIHDLPAQYQEYAKQNGSAKAAAKFSGIIMRNLLSAWLMNMLAEELWGGSPAPFDVFGYVFDSLGAGKGLTGNEYFMRAMDNLLENLTGERKLGTDEMPEGFDLQSAGEEAWNNVSRDLPFVNNALAIAGKGKSRMPLPQIPLQTMSDAWDLISGDEETREKAKSELLPDAAKELRTWIPTGNQLYKTFTGAQALYRGGSFSGSGDNERMQYQMPRNLTTGAKALLFGANSTKTAQDWFASGYDSLSAKETSAFRQLTGDGVDERTAYGIVRQLHGVKAEDGELAKAEKRQIITNADLSDEQKRALFVGTFGDSREDELQALADAGLTFKQSMDAYEEFNRIKDGDGKPGERALEFAAWVDRQGYSAAQAAEIKEQFKFWQHIPASAERYESMTAEGLSPDSAQMVTYALADLEPEPGKEKVSAIQQYNAIVQLNISDSEKSAAIRSLMNDSWQQKFDLTQNIGITPDQYVQSYQAIVDLEKYTGRGLNQGIAKAAVDSIPGLTNEQRAVLWQIQKTSWSASSNPYDPRVGAIVVTILSETPENTALPG